MCECLLFIYIYYIYGTPSRIGNTKVRCSSPNFDGVTRQSPIVTENDDRAWKCSASFEKCKFLFISSIKKIEMVTPISDGWLQSPITFSRFQRIHFMFDPFTKLILTTHLDPSPYGPCEPWLNISDILKMLENIPSDICWSDIHFLNIVPPSEEWREKIGKKHISLISLTNIQEKLSKACTLQLNLSLKIYTYKNSIY